MPKNADGAPTGCVSSATSTLGATQSRPAALCGEYTGIANDDVWYQFTPIGNGTIIVSLTGNGSFDGVLEAFSGSCGSLTSLTCSDTSQAGGSEKITMNVTSGTTYKIRVYGFYADLRNSGTFSISATGSPLPITLLSFKGEHHADKNVLHWSTATELNNQGFELQYSADGNNFNKLAFINSKAINGNRSTILSYEFADARPLSGNSWYRLKQVDKDGQSSFSNILLLKGEKINAITLSNMYPNPAKNKLKVTIAAPVSNKINLIITDVAGKIVQQQTFVLINGDNNLNVDLTGLPGGSYFIKVIDNNGYQTTVRKFVKE